MKPWARGYARLPFLPDKMPWPRLLCQSTPFLSKFLMTPPAEACALSSHDDSQQMGHLLFCFIPATLSSRACEHHLPTPV